MPSAKRMRTRKRTPEECSTWGISAQVTASTDDLLWEILLRLPVKSLLRFKSVSKQWLSLISDPHFIHWKCLKSSAVSFLALKEDCRYLRYSVFPLHGRAPLTTLTFANPPYHGMALVSSCKGLLMLCSSSRLNGSETKYYIYNPTTRQFRSLPPPPVQTAACNVGIMGFCLAFGPLKSHNYRVACAQRLSSSSHLFQLVVYSSETGYWRVSGAPLSLLPDAKFHPLVFCHGAMHWTRAGASQCFDLDRELAREIPLPLPPSGSAVSVEVIAYFGESGGHLHLVQLFHVTTKQFPIYEMERDCSGWFEKFRVDLTGFLPSPDFIPKQLLHLARGEKEEDSFLVMNVHDKVFRYYFRNKTRQVVYSTLSRRKLLQCNLSNQTHKLIGKRASITGFSIGWHHVYEYMESLSLV